MVRPLFSLFAALILLASCSSEHQALESPSSSLENCAPGSPGCNNSGAGSENKVCLSEQEIFQQSFLPFLQKHCASCHSAGGVGNGGFADKSNLDFAFQEFQLRGHAIVKSRALDPSHQSPFTGIQHTAELNKLQEFSDRELACVDADKPAEEPATPELPPLKTVEKVLPQSETAEKVRFSLPLELAETQELPNLIIEFDSLVHTSVSGEKTYHLSNLTVFADSQAVEVSRVELFLNGEELLDATTFHTASVKVPATESRVMSATTLIINRVPKYGDRLALKIGSVKAIDFAPTTFEKLTSAGGLFNRYCMSCHSGATPSGGLDFESRADLIAQNHVVPFESGLGTVIQRMENTSQPMPPAGNLPEAEIQKIRDWLEDGAL